MRYWQPNPEAWITPHMINQINQFKTFLVILIKSDLHISLAGCTVHWLPEEALSRLNPRLQCLCFKALYVSGEVTSVLLTCRSQPADSRKKRALSSSTSVTATNPLTASSRSAILLCHAQERADRKRGKRTLSSAVLEQKLQWNFSVFYCVDVFV